MTNDGIRALEAALACGKRVGFAVHDFRGNFLYWVEITRCVNLWSNTEEPCAYYRKGLDGIGEEEKAHQLPLEQKYVPDANFIIFDRLDPMNPKADELLRSAAAAQVAQKLAAEASDIRERPRFTATKKAADALAEAVKANINACYEITRAQIHRDRCEQPAWTEEALRRDAQLMMYRANGTITHVALVDALTAYESAVQMDALADSLRDTVELAQKVGSKMDSVFGAIEEKLGIKGAPFDESLTSPPACSPPDNVSIDD